jgi:hypothetical protein
MEEITNMNRATAMEILVRELTNLLGNIGFVYPGGEYLVRPIPGGRQSIGLAVWDYSPAIDLTLLVSVRIDAVLRIYHRFSGVVPGYEELSNTIGTTLNWFVGGPAKIRVTQPQELQATLNAWREPICAEVLPYLASAQSVLELDRLINIQRDILDVAHPPHSFMHHIIVAKLACNPGFDELVSFHREEMRDMGYSHELYDHLVVYLQTLQVTGT